MKTPRAFSRSLILATSAGLFATFLACGGQGSNPSAVSTPETGQAQKLVYAEPAGSGYRMVRDETSTASRLVLRLVGPEGAQIRGGVFQLKTDTSKAAWVSAGGSDAYVREGSALSLGTGAKLLKSQMSGQTLKAAIYQKGSTPAATLGSQPILSVALDLKTGTTKGAIPFSSPEAQILDAAGKTQTVTVAVGSLSAE